MYNPTTSGPKTPILTQETTAHHISDFPISQSIVTSSQDETSSVITTTGSSDESWETTIGLFYHNTEIQREKYMTETFQTNKPNEGGKILEVDHETVTIPRQTVSFFPHHDENQVAVTQVIIPVHLLSNFSNHSVSGYFTFPPHTEVQFYCINQYNVFVCICTYAGESLYTVSL